MKKKKNSSFMAMVPYIILAIVLIVALFAFNNNGSKVNTLTTGELIKEIQEKNVTEITITPKSSDGVYYVEGKLDGYGSNESFTAKVLDDEMIEEYVKENKIKKYDTNKDPGQNQIIYILVEAIPLLLLIVGAYFLFTRLSSSNNRSMDFGRSKS